MTPAQEAKVRAAIAALPKRRCLVVDPSTHPSVHDRRCELERDHELVRDSKHKRTAVFPGWHEGTVWW